MSEETKMYIEDVIITTLLISCVGEYSYSIWKEIRDDVLNEIGKQTNNGDFSHDNVVRAIGCVLYNRLGIKSEG